MYKFAELAKEYTGGTVNVEVYANGALCDEPSSVDQLMLGSLDLSRVNTNTLSSTIDEFGVFAMPYLFASTELKYKALDGEAGEMGQKLALMGALTLYLDFINLFLFLLRIFGDRRS